jgi:hypothetical protein
VPLALLTALNCAVGLLLTWAAKDELRASARGPWTSLAARAWLVHQSIIVIPIAGWWLWRAPDWAVGYVLHAARAPSAVSAGAALLIGAVGIGAFALGARQVTAHRTRWLPAASATLLGLGALTALLGVRRFLSVTSYVHFHGGLGVTPTARASAPWGLLAGLLGWSLASGMMLGSLRLRARALTLRNRR